MRYLSNSISLHLKKKENPTYSGSLKQDGNEAAGGDTLLGCGAPTNSNKKWGYDIRWCFLVSFRRHYKDECFSAAHSTWKQLTEIKQKNKRRLCLCHDSGAVGETGRCLIATVICEDMSHWIRVLSFPRFKGCIYVKWWNFPGFSTSSNTLPLSKQSLYPQSY